MSSPILAFMAIFPRPSTPRAFVADLKAFLHQQNRHKLMIAVVSGLMPMIIVWGFYVDSKTDKPKAQVIFVESWPSTRTDAEIEKQNIADQKVRDAQRKAKQEEYRRVADKLGIEY
ncbi:hypothetical protein [Rhizorhabdus sp.]|jgi:hypothetical protein|uniref:hypothetical protein n=2 Tax=Rhizorhabdus sp. TaxID=1968843 RepID=UPI0025F1CD1F|nr:hypothetical protein [Rhizorhabdus sp.]